MRADVEIVHDQMYRLILVVLGGGEVDAGQAVARWRGALHIVADRFLAFALTGLMFA